MAEAKSPSGLSRALNAAWLRPFLFLAFIVAAWDLSIRLFHIPAYQIPSPGDVVAVLWTDWPELLRQSWPTTYATICGFALSALFGIPVAMLIAGSKTVESYVYPLLVFSQSVPKIAIAPLFVVWFGFGIIPKVISAFLDFEVDTLGGINALGLAVIERCVLAIDIPVQHQHDLVGCGGRRHGQRGPGQCCNNCSDQSHQIILPLFLFLCTNPRQQK